jgi:hypothetical protein
MRSVLMAVAASTALLAQAPRPAPDLAIQMNGKGAIQLREYRGKIVVVTFIYTT